VYRLLVEAVAEHVVDGCVRAVDRDLREVRSDQAGELCVDVREKPPLQQRIVGEVDTRNDIGRTAGHLFCLGEEIVRIAIEHHATYDAKRDQFLGNDFGRVQHIER